KAILEYAGDGAAQLTISEVEEIPGHGIKGIAQGEEALAGNLRLLERHGIDFPASLRAIVDTLVVVAINGKYVGHLTISDRIKEGTAQTLRRLRGTNIQKTVMLSGDRTSMVDSVAQELGIDEAYGDLLPQDKVHKVEEL